MNGSGRKELTALCTASAIAHFWGLGVRVMGLEVGYDRRGLGVRSTRRWRADLVAVDEPEGPTGQVAVHVIEVKSSRADLLREDLSGGKWTATDLPGNFHPWVVIGPEVHADDVQRIPRHWGILNVPSSSGIDGGGRLRVVRTSRSGEGFGVELRAEAYKTIAGSRTIVGLLPSMQGLDREKQVWQIYKRIIREPTTTNPTGDSDD